MTRRVVTATAHRDLQRLGASEGERRRHVARSQGADDQRRPAVDQRVEAAADPVEAGVPGLDHGTGNRPSQLAEVLGRGR
jgi:hypothetical protein